MKQSFDVIIVGAGLVGSSLALLLRQYIAQGLRVALIDEHPLDHKQIQQPSFDERTTALSLGTQRILQGMSLWSHLADSACPIHHIQVSQQGQFGRVRLHSQQAKVDALGYVMPNRVFGQVLLQQLEKTESLSTFAPARVEHYRMTAQGVELSLRQSDEYYELQGRLLVLADGATSAGCSQLGIEQQRYDYAQTALICNVSFDRAHDYWAYERFTLGGPLALLPMQGNRFALVWCLPKQQAQEYKELDEATFNQCLQRAIGFDKGRITKSGERGDYPLALTRASEQVRRHVVVLGNAAHALHPVAGQGFNLALRDTQTLARNIGQTYKQGVTDLGELTHLLAYQAAQANDQALTVGLSHQLPTQFSQAGQGWSMLRGLGLTMMDSLPVAKTVFARQAMGLVGPLVPWQP